MATIYSLYLLDPCLVYDPLQGAEAIGTFSVSSVLPGEPSPTPKICSEIYWTTVRSLWTKTQPLNSSFYNYQSIVATCVGHN